MLIGSDFNSKCSKILLLAAESSQFEANIKVSVQEISADLDIDRTEIRNMFQYLADLKLINVESIGGPLLYGHISLTPKGLIKVYAEEKKNNRLQ